VEVTFRDDSTTQIKGKGNIDLKMTPGKILTLKDVLLVPPVRRNLISGSFLVKLGFKIILQVQ